MSTQGQERQTRVSRFPIPTLAEIFDGPLANWYRRVAQWRRRGMLGRAHRARRRDMCFEALEPRMLLSADLAPEVAHALGVGTAQLGTRVDGFLAGDALSQRVPLLLDLYKDPNTKAAVREAPTVGRMLSVPVAADTTDLQPLDANGDGTVDAGEFLQGWFFEPVSNYLKYNVPSNATNKDFTDFLTQGGFLNGGLDQSLTNLSDGTLLPDGTPGHYSVDFSINTGQVSGLTQVADLTQSPNAAVVFSVGFQLTVARSGMPIDLGLQADAYKLAFADSNSNPQTTTIPVSSTLTFGYDFGAFTGGKDATAVNAGDFFVRTSDPLLTSVSAKSDSFSRFLNVGFLGAQVKGGKFDLAANLRGDLLDPNDPAALGFAADQRGVESTSGVVTADTTVPNLNLPHDVGFFLRVGKAGINTPVSLAQTNAADLATLAGDLQNALDAAGLGGVVTASTSGSQLQFALVPTSDSPLGLPNESYGQFGSIVGTPNGMAAGGPNNFEYPADQSFLLSVGGAVPKLVTVHFPDPAKSDIGLGYDQQASLVDDLVAPSAPSAFNVSGDAGFTVTVTRSNGTQAAQTFTLASGDTIGNGNAGALAGDINGKLDPTLSGMIDVEAIGGKIAFHALDGSVVAGIRVQASGTATTEIGLAPDAEVTSKLTAAGNAISTGVLSGTATLDLSWTTVGPASHMQRITVAPDTTNGDVAALAADVDAALVSAGVPIHAIADGSKVVLVAKDISVAAFEVKVGNQNIDDLVTDVNAALANAGLTGIVNAVSVGTDQLMLSSVGQYAGKSLEISKTLTFDAGVTYAELVITPDDTLFGHGPGDNSHATFDLPVQVLSGLDDASNPGHPWNPPNVAIVGNFNPLEESSTVHYDGDVTKRFELNLTLDPSLEGQDSPVSSVPDSSSLTDKIELVNMAKLLNFSLISAEDMVGMLSSLGTALQQIGQSAPFSNYDIPLAAAVLSGALNFTENNDKKQYAGLVDTLLYDTGSDITLGTSDDAEKLLKQALDENNKPILGADGKPLLIPAFPTAQKLADALNTILQAPLSGVGGINAAYDPRHDVNELTYQVDLTANDNTATTTHTTPQFEYNVPLDHFAKLSVATTIVGSDPLAPVPDAQKEVTLDGRTGLAMTFGINLSPPGAIIDGSTLLQELNGGGYEYAIAANTGVHVRDQSAITGTVSIDTVKPSNPPGKAVPQLSEDANFDIIVNGTSYAVTIPKADTVNRSIQDLVADVNIALTNAKVGNTVVSLSSTIGADFDTKVELDQNGNIALDQAKNPIYHQYLVLFAKDPNTTFTISAPAGGSAVGELGLTDGAISNRTDFIITDSHGVNYNIVLDPTHLNRTDAAYHLADGLPNNPTVQDVINTINAVTGGGSPLSHAVTAEFNSTHTGLRLVDTTGGSRALSVQAENGSQALRDLGLFGAGNIGTQNAFGGDSHLIEGKAIGQTHLDQRFFVRDAVMRIDGLRVRTPDVAPLTGQPIPGVGLFGIVGVNTTVSGTMIANVTADLHKPADAHEPSNQVTLQQLLKGTDVVSDPVVSKPGELAYDSLGGVNFAPGQMISNGAGTATALVVAQDGSGASGTLTLADVKGTFTDGDTISNATATTPATSTATVQIGVTPAENFGTFTLHVDVQPGFGDPGFVGTSFAALAGESDTFTFDITDFGDPLNGTPPAADVVLSGIGALANFEQLDYSNLASALHGLQDVLDKVNGNGNINDGFKLLNTKLPAINKSVSDLLSLVDGFAASVVNSDNVLTAAKNALDGTLDTPALRLQDIPNALRGAFGLPDPSLPGAVNGVQLVYDSADHMLKAKLVLENKLSTELGLDIDVGNNLPHLTSGGVLKVKGTLDMNLDFGIDLHAPSNAYLYNDSNISADLHVEGEGQRYAGGQDGLGLVFYAALGPLQVFIQDGDATMDVAFQLPGLKGLDPELLSSVAFADFKDPVITKDNIDIGLPMFYGGEGPNAYLGDFTATGKLEDPPGLTVTTPDFSGIAAEIAAGTIAFDPFSNISLAIDGVDVYLQDLSAIISNDVLGVKLPFIGNQMADDLFIEDFRNTLVRTLKNGIEGAINPTPDTVTQLIKTALGSYLQGQVDFHTNVNDGIATPDQFYDEWDFTIHHQDPVDHPTTLDNFDIGVSNLGLDLNTPVDVAFDWTINFGFGVNFAEGAYVNVPKTSNASLEPSASDVSLDLGITLPSGSHSGTLGYLPLDATQNAASGADVHFGIDVQNSNANAPDPNHIGFSDLGAIAMVANLHGTTLAGATDAASLHLVTHANAGLPELSTDFIFDWGLPDAVISTSDSVASTLAGDDAVTPGIQKIALNSIVLHSDTVVGNVLGPLLDKLQKYVDPFMPVVDTLTAPIPILSDLAGRPFTLLDLASTFGNFDASAANFIDAVGNVADLLGKIDGIVGIPDLPVGSLTIYDPSAGIDSFTPGGPDGLDKLALGTKDNPGKGLTLNSDFETIGDGTTGPKNSFLDAVRHNGLIEGLCLKIFRDPLQSVMMLTDQTATIVKYTVPPLSAGFDYLQVFPVWGPLAVAIDIGFNFTVDLHEVGFDTHGYERYAEGGFRDPTEILNGFYFSDGVSNGVDSPEVSMTFALSGDAELNLGAARAGVGGGIDATINFDWHDSIPDNRVHLDEILGNITGPGGDKVDPLAAFDVSGDLSFQLFAFLDINLIGFHEKFDITKENTLYSFNDTPNRAPILATVIGASDTKPATLRLNMGPNAKDRLNGDTSDGNEDFQVKYIDSTHIDVWSPELGVSESSPQHYENKGGFDNIVGLGGQGNDIIQLHNFDGSHIRGDFDGGAGDDTIEYVDSTGSESAPGARIIGGPGNDTLTGGEYNDVIIGGAGNDTINGGGGHDVLFGDQGTYADSLAEPYLSSRISVGDGTDTINGGAGDDVIFGGGGNDTLDGGMGNDVVIGDGGRFAYTKIGGVVNGVDTSHIDVASLRPAPYVPSPIVTSDPTDPATISNQIDAVYDQVVGTFKGTDFGFGGNDTISGGGGDDILLGGSGDDTIYGDEVTADPLHDGADIILGGKGFDDLHGGGGNDEIFGGDQADTIAGDGGNDVISGGAGGDFIHGNEGDDVIKGDSGADVIFGDAGDDQIFGQTEPDVLFGGTGNDLVVGGSGDDIMFGDDGLVAKLNPGTDTGYKVIGIGPLSLLNGAFSDGDKRSLDLIVTNVVTGDGNDIMSGGAGADIMLGGGGDDLMGGDVDPRLPSAGTKTPVSDDVMIGDGGRISFDQRRFRTIETVAGPDTTGMPFDDIIYGDNGNDYIFGGRGNDFLFGGHGKVVDPATWTVGDSRGATDAGASDNDIIVGDNGKMSFADGSIPANFGVLAKVETTDSSNDTGGNDYVEGQLGDDVIFGGANANAGFDTLFGNDGNDVILGDNGVLNWDSNDPTHDLTTLDLISSDPGAVGGGDVISGNAGNDVLIGGTGDDIMYGDDATASAGAADGEDIMLGDNADIFLSGTVGRLKVQVATMPAGSAVETITTTDKSESTGGADTMSGNAGSDVMLGGVNNGGTDTMYGDQAVPTPGSIALDGGDVLLGDNGELDFGLDADLTTLDLIHSHQDGLGGHDVISGGAGADVAIGGTGDDTVYGDDAGADAGASDLSDVLLGDNADVFLVAPDGASGGDLRLVLGAAVATIRTTDEQHPGYGGVDTISGNAGGDLIAGGVKGDFLYGDRVAPTADTTLSDGNDVILGDNGAFEWLSSGRLGDIAPGIVAANNPGLEAHFSAGSDTELTTLDLVTTEQPTSGGRDTIYGDQGSDVIFGGTDSDTIYGDDGDGTGSAGNNDVLFGDQGRIYPHFSALSDFNSRNFFAIYTGDNAGGNSNGAGDIMYGEEGDDVMLGQQGDDRMWGGSGNDDMIGGHNVPGGYDELSAPVINATLDPAVNDLMDGGSGNDAMAGDNAIIWRRGDTISPRFRELTAASIYTTTAATITANVGTDSQNDPNGTVGRDIQLLDHSDAVQANPLGRFGNDVMAGGANNDVMFGELGNDLMQGDGSISSSPAAAEFISDAINVTDSGGNSGEKLYFDIPEQAATDGADYMEGNGGNDLMYGGLGQDDMIGGSSTLFGLAGPETLRPDGSDVMYGGAGIRIGRNDIGDATEVLATGVITTNDGGHARDADYMVGDNANVYRLVDANDQFLTFNYDNYAGGLRIVPRAVEQLDYTLGGADYAGGAYTAWGAANADNGAADQIHGESGDDVIFGMTGSDVLFGDGQDDDIIGGYGNDWISGGTGQDGVIGDDGLIYTSRNSTLGEPLYGVAGLLAHDPSTKASNGNVLDELITTPGDIQTAVINVSGELKKTADLVPMSFDPHWNAQDDEFPDTTGNKPFADDVIFGGLGSDWLHGGSGDDAISGAEALADAYVPTFDSNGTPNGLLDLGYDAVGVHAAQNPGDVLAFNTQDLDGRHLNNRFRAGEFFLYDEYDPLRKIQLDANGNLWKSADQGTAYEFLLNFNQNEGVLRPGGTTNLNGNQATTYPDTYDDGKDSIFGDTGNDWLVGGTGRDDLYGGWGNDLINADDNQTTHGNLNDQPDTSPYYEDRAYGGAGRDVLIGNTGGDRLIDWVGEYNSYLVPYAPFGQASVSRTLMPHLHEFLYALSAGDGSDPTRANDTGSDPARNGEPDAEMGLVLQKDVAWTDQTGAPSDPQAGNIPGGKRDVLRSANMNDGTLSGFAVDSGNFAVANGTLQVSAQSLGLEATAVLPLDDQLPSYYEVLSTVTVEKPTAGWKANSYIVYDYFDSSDFKFAGINVSTNEVEIGYHDAAGWHVVTDAPQQLKAGTYYNMLVAVNGTNVTLAVDNKAVLSYSFAPRMIDGDAYNLNMGLVGIGSNDSRGTFDNFTVQRVPPAWTLQQSQEFASGTGTMFGGLESGAWTLADGRYTAAGPAASLVDLGLNRGLETDAALELSATLSTDGAGGFVFDRYAADDYKFALLDANANEVLLGHVSPKDGTALDAAFAMPVDAGADYTLTLRLKGTSASLSLGGQAVGGYVYNAVVVDGDFGLLASAGTTSFASATVKTSDSAFYVPQSAMLAFAPAATTSGPAVTQSELDTITQFAISAWTDELGAGNALLTGLADARFGVADLAGNELGFTEGNTVLIDTNAAGYGWFVDSSPASSSEFRVRLDQNILAAAPESAAFGHMDLVTVVEHEIGHLLGFEHSDAGAFGVMREDLPAGTRYLLASESTAQVSQAQSKPSAPPEFDAYAAWEGAAVGAGIDWQADFKGGWEVKLSPYDTGKPATGDSNLAPFDQDLLAKLDAHKHGADFDQMGQDLLGKNA